MPSGAAEIAPDSSTGVISCIAGTSAGQAVTASRMMSVGTAESVSSGRAPPWELTRSPRSRRPFVRCWMLPRRAASSSRPFSSAGTRRAGSSSRVARSTSRTRRPRIRRRSARLGVTAGALELAEAGAHRRGTPRSSWRSRSKIGTNNPRRSTGVVKPATSRGGSVREPREEARARLQGARRARI